MDKGMRNILIVLGVFSLLSLLSAVKFFQIERTTHREYLKVKSENVQLDQRVSLLSQQRLDLARELKVVKKESGEINREKEELKQKHRALINEKKKLSIQVEMLIQEKEGLEKKISRVEAEGFLSGLLRKKVSLEVKVKKLEQRFQKTDDLNEEIKAITKAKLELKQQLTQEKEVSESLSKNFLRERQARLEGLNKLNKAKSEKDELQVVLDQAMDKNASLEKKLAGLKEELGFFAQEREKLIAQITGVERTFKGKMAKLNLAGAKTEKTIEKSEIENQKAVELPPIIVKAESVSLPAPAKPERIIPEQAAPPQGLRGKIITINEEHDFVVIDLGQNDGLEMGMVFEVYRNKKEIAKVKVVGARKQISAADIISLKGRAKIKPGDVVSRRK